MRTRATGRPNSHRELRLVNESAAESLAEGLEGRLTLHRLGVFAELGVSFKTTSLFETVTARFEATPQRATGARAIRGCAVVAPP